MPPAKRKPSFSASIARRRKSKNDAQQLQLPQGPVNSRRTAEENRIRFLKGPIDKKEMEKVTNQDIKKEHRAVTQCQPGPVLDFLGYETDLQKLQEGMTVSRPSLKTIEKRMREDDERQRSKRDIIRKNTLEGQQSSSKDEAEESINDAKNEDKHVKTSSKQAESSIAIGSPSDTKAAKPTGKSSSSRSGSVSSSSSGSSSEDSESEDSSLSGASDKVEVQNEDAWDDKVAIDLDIPFHKVNVEAYEDWERKGFKIEPGYPKSLTREEPDKIMWIRTGSALRK